MKFQGNQNLVTISLLTVFYAVGVVGHWLPSLLPWMLLLTPWFLLAAGLAVGAVYSRGSDLLELAWWFVPVFMVTFALESLGVATGAIFGAYHYTSALGALVLGVPPIIGLNWVLVVLGFTTLVRSWLPQAPMAARLALIGLGCVGFDFLLEPVAIALGYWVWHGGEVPLQNYFAWGLIAIAGAWWAERFPGLPKSPLLGWYALLQATFFLALGLIGAHS